ncbi:MAG: NAD(P)H-dependent flavin oxidoreductase [Beijerinckiaceae bacterium]
MTAFRAMHGLIFEIDHAIRVLTMLPKHSEIQCSVDCEVCMLDRLAIPIIQAPMLGATTQAIAIAVSQAGGMGSLAAAGMAPAALTQAIAAIRAATDKPFSVNLFIQDPAQPDSDTVRAAMALLQPWRERFGLPLQAIPNQWAEPFEPQFAALVEAAPPIASFTFGCLTRAQVSALRARGTWVVGTATTVAEARVWAEAGADAICAQGIEAGGHRGTFLKSVAESSIGTMALVATVRAAVNVPVIAAGGITTGEGIAAALALGASAVQIGTAYLLSEEAVTSAPWRARIENAGDDATRLTRAFSGRTARGLDNAFMQAMRPVEDTVAPYPVQNALTQELRAAAAKAGSSDAISLWAGQSVALARSGSAAAITQTLWREAQQALRHATNRWVVPG